MGTVDRRGLLRMLGASAVVVGSGCVDSLTSRPRYLEAVHVRNDDDTDHEFELTITQGGDVVQETTIELDRSQGPDRVDCEWSGRGPFVVTCTLSGDGTEMVQIADIQEGSGEYAQVTFVATTGGELSWSGFVDDGGVRSCSGTPSG